MWRIDGSIAQLAAEPLMGRLDLSRPADGLVAIRWHGRPVADCRLLQVRAGTATDEAHMPLEAYVRGTDLLAAYDLSAADVRQRSAIRCHLCWRWISHQDVGACGLELTVSVQTELPDDDPSLSLGSDVASSEALRLVDRTAPRLEPLAAGLWRASDSPAGEGLGAFACRLAGQAGWYLEMMHPEDFASLSVGVGMPSVSVRSRFSVFGERLEKGVVRRSRIQGLLLVDAAAVTTCYRRFMDSPVPLTA
jgi:hypothetical protein